MDLPIGYLVVCVQLQYVCNIAVVVAEVNISYIAVMLSSAVNIV